MPKNGTANSQAPVCGLGSCGVHRMVGVVGAGLAEREHCVEEGCLSIVRLSTRLARSGYVVCANGPDIAVRGARGCRSAVVPVRARHASRVSHTGRSLWCRVRYALWPRFGNLHSVAAHHTQRPEYLVSIFRSRITSGRRKLNRQRAMPKYDTANSHAPLNT